MSLTDEFFPFRVAFDRSLIIREVGKSLLKLNPAIEVGCQFKDFFSLNEINGDLTFETLHKLRHTSVHLQLKSPSIPMRVQFQVEQDQITALGSPQFETLEDFEQSGLDVNDFAPFDASIDYLFLRCSKDVTLEEHRSVLLQVEEHTKVRNRLDHVEKTLADDLQAAGDLLIRIDTSGSILAARSSRQELLPLSEDELIGKNIFIVWPQLSVPLREAIVQLQAVSPVPFSYSVVKDEGQIHCDARISKTANHEMLILARDVTEQRLLEIKLEHQATHDPLTDLPNRTLFSQKVQSALTTKSLVAVLFIDLDGFKLINDRHGHHLGDEVLQHVAQSLRECLGDCDSAARLGGDEFAVVLSGLSSKKEAEESAQRIIHRLKQPCRVGHRSLSVSASIGIATTYDAKDLTTLFQFADIAMYQAKAAQKNCYRVFKSSMYEELLRHDTLRQQLMTAASQGQFINHYQPMVETETGRIVGVESLARWQHPIRGLLLPSEFIHAAQESEAIVRLGEQTLKNACTDAKLWDHEGLAPAQLHFNVSSRQLRKSCLTSLVESCLSESGIEPGRITAEIKEETMQHDFELARREIEKLRDIGVQVALDEFGAGNYSLAFLERLALDSVKLSRSFVHQLGQSQQNNKLVQAVIELARAFGLEVVAVGVENRVQRDLLEEYGCTIIQGELYCSAMASEDIAALGSYIAKDDLLPA